MLQVRVGQLPGKIVEVALESDSVVEDALRAAELDFEDGAEVTVNGHPVELDTRVRNKDLILLVEQIAGA